MNRPSREEALLQTAVIWAARSTCSRRHVGCVIHREGRILVQGYNGAPTGLPHCPDIGQPPFHSPETCRAVHAEQNAIAWAARVGVGLLGSQLVCTDEPCLSCARSIINAGIESVVYVRPYRLNDGLVLLGEAGIEVSRNFASPLPA